MPHIQKWFFQFSEILCRVTICYGAMISLLLLRPTISGMQRLSQFLEPGQFAHRPADLAIHTNKAYTMVVGGWRVPSSFTENEVSHFIDVHRVLVNVAIFVVISICILLVLISREHAASGWQRKPLRTAAGGVLILSVLCAWQFEAIFFRFHELFFPQGNYSFSSDSLIIQVFPPLFWLLNAVFLQLGVAGLLWWQAEALDPKKSDET